MKTKLDLLLDRVKYAEHELTLDCIKLTPNAAEVVQREAERRGFTASYDGRFMLIRDLRAPVPRGTK